MTAMPTDENVPPGLFREFNNERSVGGAVARFRCAAPSFSRQKIRSTLSRVSITDAMHARRLNHRTFFFLRGGE